MGGHVSGRGRQLLEGAIDLHLHAGPSLRKRTGDAWDACAAGAAVGMRGAVLKDHDRLTASDAELASRRAGSTFQPFGALCLNAPVGGLNPAAVETAARLGARVIFLPTDSAYNDGEHWARHLDDPQGQRSHVVGEELRRYTQRIRVLDDTGSLTPETQTVLDTCVREDATVCTGHLSAEEVSRVV
jgi:hypothetical protein